MSLKHLLPATIDNWRLQDSTTRYDRESIFDYIDGAGEVYNSYDFSEVLVTRYVRQDGAEIAVELFDMGNFYDAYGVFSYAREREEAGIGGGYELRGSVLCFWQNRYYVCVAAKTQMESLDTVLRSVAVGVSGQLPPASTRPELLELLPTDQLIPFSERFFHVRSALNYHYYLARDNILGLTAKTDVVLARYQPGSTFLLIAKYESGVEAETAHSSFRQGFLPDSQAQTVEVDKGKFVSSKCVERYLIVALDAPTKTEAGHLINAVVSKITEQNN